MPANDFASQLNADADRLAAERGIAPELARMVLSLIIANAAEGMGWTDALTAERYRKAVRAEYMSA